MARPESASIRAGSYHYFRERANRAVAAAGNLFSSPVGCRALAEHFRWIVHRFTCVRRPCGSGRVPTHLLVGRAFDCVGGKDELGDGSFGGSVQSAGYRVVSFTALPRVAGSLVRDLLSAARFPGPGAGALEPAGGIRPCGTAALGVL